MTITVAAMAPPRWRRAWRVAAILCAGTLVGSFIADYAFFNVFLSSRWDRYRPLALHATIWSEGYDERRFNQVKAGMSRDEVVAAAGRPLQTLQDGDSEILMYSQIGHYASPATKGFQRRWIILKDARVATIDDGYSSAEC